MTLSTLALDVLRAGCVLPEVGPQTVAASDSNPAPGAAATPSSRDRVGLGGDRPIGVTGASRPVALIVTAILGGFDSTGREPR